MKSIGSFRPRAVWSASPIFTGLLALIFLTLPAFANAADSVGTALGQALVANKWSWTRHDEKTGVWRTTLTFHQDGTISNPTDHHTWYWWVIDDKTVHIQFHPEPESPSIANLKAGMNLVFTDDLKDYRGIYIPNPKSLTASGERKGPTGEVIDIAKIRLAREDDGAAAAAPAAPAAPGAPESPSHAPAPVAKSPPPSKQIEPFLEPSLNAILAPLGENPKMPRIPVETLRASLGAGVVTAKTPAQQQIYQCAMAVCDALTNGMDERAQARAAAIQSGLLPSISTGGGIVKMMPLHGWDAGYAGDAIRKKQKDERDYADKQAKDVSNFADSAAHKAWVAKTTILRDNAMGLYTKLVQLEAADSVAEAAR